MTDLRTIERGSIRAFVQEAADAGQLAGRVLDYGAGRMPYRDIVEAAGGEYHAYDRQRFPANASGEDLGGSPSRELWDALLVNQVDQYVWEIETLFDFFFRLLRPAGYLVMTGPTTWPEVETEDLRRLTKSGARMLAERAGFRIGELRSRAGIDMYGEHWSLGWGLLAVRSRHLVYGLTDPRTGLVRYVGKTSQAPRERLRQHIGAARNEWTTRGQQKRLWKWIRSLGDADPGIVVLEADSDDIDACERHWIGKLRGEGQTLCNVTNGGDGRARGFTHSAEEIARRRAYRPAPETVAKIAAANTGQKRSPQFRERLRDVAFARPRVISDEDVIAIRESQQKAPEVASRYGISASYVYAIRAGKKPQGFARG